MRRLAYLVPLLVLLSACGGAEESDNAAPQVSTVAAGKLTACTDMPYEPFEFSQDGTDRGIDVDLVRAIAKDFGLTAEFRNLDFDDTFAALGRNECDLVASAVSITPERQRAYLFSSGYFEVSQSLLVRAADRPRFGDLAALGGQRLGVQKATTGAAYAAKHAPRATIVPYEDASEAVQALAGGKVAGVVQDFPINSYEARKNTQLAVVATFNDTTREEYGFVFRPGHEALRDAVDGSLKNIRLDGRYDDILLTYLGAATAGP